MSYPCYSSGPLTQVGDTQTLTHQFGVGPDTTVFGGPEEDGSYALHVVEIHDAYEDVLTLKGDKRAIRQMAMNILGCLDALED